MKRKLVSAVVIMVLTLSLVGANAFVVNTKAVSSEKNLSKIVDGLKESVDKFHRTHIQDSNGNRTIIDEDFKPIKSTKKGNNLPSSYVAPYTSVKDQNAFNSCWLFGEMGSLESNLMNKAGYSGGLVDEDPIDLSEAQGVYVQYNRQTEEGTISGTVSADSDNDVERRSDQYYGFGEGGWPFDASMAVSANKGAALESDNPYISTSRNSRSTDSITMARLAASNYRLNRYNIKSAEGLPEIYAIVESSGSKTRVYNPNARNIWKNKIMDNGAISANYYQVKDSKYNHYWGPNASQYLTPPNFWYYDANARNRFGTNHVITVVGFDDNYSRYNFIDRYTSQNYDSLVGEIVYIKMDGDMPDVVFDEDGHLVSITTSSTQRDGFEPFVVPKEDGAWIIKNSYGKGTASAKVYDYGIMHMSYCEETLSETVASVVEEDLNQIQNNEKTYDTTLTHSSMMGEVSDCFGSDGKASEIYSIDSDKDIEIGQIGYWTGKQNTTTRLKIYSDLQDTSNPESGTLVYDSGSITDNYTGYHTVTLDEKVNLLHSTNASVVISQDYNGSDVIMIEVDYANASSAEYLYNSNEGDTLYYDDGEWVDSKVVDEQAQKSGLTVGNSTVKLLGNATNVEPEPTTKPEYTVSVDGNETIVEGGDEYQFPNTSENGYADEEYETLYAPRQTITVNSNITVNSIPNIDFQMARGASIRKLSPAGIRFVSQATCNDSSLLESDKVQCGTILTSEDYYTNEFDETLTLDTYEEFKDNPRVSIYILENDQGWYKDTIGMFSAGIINIREPNWNRNFIAQGYITFNYCNDTKKTIYAGVSLPRSIVYVAEGIRDSGYQGCTAEEIAFIDRILEYAE